MQNISKTKADEALFTGRVVYDKNPDKPMFYFEFAYNGHSVLLSYEMLVDSLYKGLDKKFLNVNFLFSWLNENCECTM